MSEVVVNQEEVNRIDSELQAQIQSKLEAWKQNAELLTSLRECVVALNLFYPVRMQMLSKTRSSEAFDNALTHAKSTLSKYER